MKSQPKVAMWMGAALCVAMALAICVLIVFGTEERGIRAALAAVARLAFLLFWPAYSASALASLFGPRFEPLKRCAREFGLAFASALLVHLGLVGWLYLLGAAPGVGTFIFFGIAALWVYLLAIFSIKRLQKVLGPKSWWILRSVGMNYVAYAFAIDFLKSPLGGGTKHVLEYMPFAVLSIVGPTLRFAAMAQLVGSRWREPPHQNG